MTNCIDGNLHATANEGYSALRQQLWTALDDEIGLLDCDFYRWKIGIFCWCSPEVQSCSTGFCFAGFFLSYNPDLASDPYGEDGCIWSFNYFFYNKKLKRIVFFTCRAITLVKIKYIFKSLNVSLMTSFSLMLFSGSNSCIDSGYGNDLMMDMDDEDDLDEVIEGIEVNFNGWARLLLFSHFLFGPVLMLTLLDWKSGRNLLVDSHHICDRLCNLYAC